MGKAIKFYPLVGVAVSAFILLTLTVFLSVFNPLWRIIFPIFGSASVGFSCWVIEKSRGASVGGILVSLLIYYYLPILYYLAVVYFLCSLIIADRISESKYKDGLAILFFFLCLMIWGFSMWYNITAKLEIYIQVPLTVLLIAWVCVFVFSPAISYKFYFASGIFFLIYLFSLFVIPDILFSHNYTEQSGVIKLYEFLWFLPPFLIGGYAIGSGIEATIVGRIRKMLEKRREHRQKISYYKSKIKSWKEEGYNILELEELKNLDLVEEKIRGYESRIHRLKEIERELNSLNTQGFEKEVQSIRSKLKDPEKAELAEKEFLELKRNIEKSERMKEEIIAMIDNAISRLKR